MSHICVWKYTIYCEELPSDTNIFRIFTTVVKKLQL